MQRQTNHIQRRPKINSPRTILLLIILTLILQPQFFERNLYLNEIASLFGLFALIYKTNRKMFRRPEVLATLLFISWGIIRSIFSVFSIESPYAYFRHQSIIYSALCFFLAIWLYKDVQYWFHNLSKIIKRSIIAITVIPIPGLIYRLSALYIYPFVSEGKNLKLRLLFIATCVVALSISHGGGSGIIALSVAFFFYLIITKPVLFWFFSLTGLICTGLLYAYNYEAFSTSESLGLISLYTALPILAEDPNSLIRTYFWHLSINRALDSYGLGIGFGTHLFSDWQIPLVFEDSTTNDDLIYFLFPHNSFLGVFARMGAIGLITLIVIVVTTLKSYSMKYKEINQFDFSILTTFAFAISVSLLNVVIESPITAGVFWFIVGLASCNGSQLKTHTKQGQLSYQTKLRREI